MTTLTYSNLPEAIGTDLGHSRWILIDQERINSFAEATEDRQWIHVDPVRAAAGPFGTTIAHGYLTLSLIAAVLDEILAVEDVGMSINYGTDRVRFPAPVASGRQVRGRGEIVDVTPANSGLQVTVRITMEIENETRPACVADVLLRLLPQQNPGR